MNESRGSRSAYYSEIMESEGNLTSDPKDISSAQDGSVVAFRLKCKWRNHLGGSGERYRSCICTNYHAKNILKLKEGDRLNVRGRVQGNQYPILKDGVEVMVDEDQIVVDWAGVSLRYGEVHPDRTGIHSEEAETESESSTRRGRRRRHHDESDTDESSQETTEDSTESAEPVSGRRRRRGSSEGTESSTSTVTEEPREHRSRRTRPSPEARARREGRSTGQEEQPQRRVVVHGDQGED